MENININKCNVCSSDITTLIELPDLPLTGLYTKNPNPTKCSYDNNFAYCNTCGHGMLTTQIDPSIIYNDTYTHRTSKSNYAMRGVKVLLDVLEEYTNIVEYGTVLDIGCSDGYLLHAMVSNNKKIGIDAVSESKYTEISSAIFFVTQVLE